MATEITMPKLSDTMTEGQLGAWRKSVGERIERGDIIAEVETDKATMDLEAFVSGILLEAGSGRRVGTGRNRNRLDRRAGRNGPSIFPNECYSNAGDGFSRSISGFTSTDPSTDPSRIRSNS